MSMHPDMLERLAYDHQRQMLREAESERQAMRAHMERAGLVLRMRLRLSALLLALSRAAQPRDAASARGASVERSLA